MTQNSTPLQNVNCVLDKLGELKESEALFDVFDLVIYFMDYKQSTQPQIVQLDLIKGAYRSKASKLIEEMEACLREAQKSLM